MASAGDWYQILKAIVDRRLDPYFREVENPSRRAPWTRRHVLEDWKESRILTSTCLSLDAETSKLGVIHHAEHSSKNRHITVAYDPRVLPSGQLTHLLATQPADVWQAYLQAVFGTTDTLKDIVGVFVESCKVAVADIYVHLPTIQDTQTWEAWHISSVRALSFNYCSGTEKVVINGVTNAQANKGRSWAVEGGA